MKTDTSREANQWTWRAYAKAGLALATTVAVIVAAKTYGWMPGGLWSDDKGENALSLVDAPDNLLPISDLMPTNLKIGRKLLAEDSVLGQEFQISTYTAENQTQPTTAVLSDGGFVIAWESGYQDGLAWQSDGDGLGEGIYARRFNDAGTAERNEFQVNTYTLLGQRSPANTSLIFDDFVVVWASEDRDWSQEGIYIHRYNTARGVIGSEFQISPYIGINQQASTVASLADGQTTPYIGELDLRVEDADDILTYRIGEREGAHAHDDKGMRKPPTFSNNTRAFFCVSRNWMRDTVVNAGVTDGVNFQAQTPITLHFSANSEPPDDPEKNSTSNWLVVSGGLVGGAAVIVAAILCYLSKCCCKSKSQSQLESASQLSLENLSRGGRGGDETALDVSAISDAADDEKSDQGSGDVLASMWVLVTPSDLGEAVDSDRSESALSSACP